MDGPERTGRQHRDDPGGIGFAGIVTHEMGHALNLAHTQANGATQIPNLPDPPQPQAATRPGSAGRTPTQVETMYPFLTAAPGGTGEFMATVDLLDDTAALSDLYPGPGWPANKGTIRGQILDSSGNPVTGINVIARNIADPFHDCTSYISGQVSKGNAGPDGSFVMNGLTPGASYVLYADQLLIGAFAVPVPIVLPGPEEYFNGPLESGDGSTDDRCAWSPVAATAGSPVTADITFNHFPGAPTFLTAPDTSVESIPYDITSDGGIVVGGAGFDGPIFRWDVNANTFDLIGGTLAGQCGISDDGLKIAANVVDTDGINKAAIYANDAWTILPSVPGAVPCEQQQRRALGHAGLRHLGRRFDRGRVVLRHPGVRHVDHPWLQVDCRRRNRGAPQGRRPQQGQPRQRRQLRRIGDRRLGRRQLGTAARRALEQRCSIPDQDEQPVGR